eukprot:153686-Pyramimonas_sp.AAC.1
MCPPPLATGCPVECPSLSSRICSCRTGVHVDREAFHQKVLASDTRTLAAHDRRGSRRGPSTALAAALTVGSIAGRVAG